MRLNRVTITGLDEWTDFNEVRRLTAAYPFVEWGVLFSSSKTSAPRYPSLERIGAIVSLGLPNLSCHLCGAAAKDFVSGERPGQKFADVYSEGYEFTRIQLNVGNMLDTVHRGSFEAAMARPQFSGMRFILQVGRGGIFDWMRGLDVDFLLDASGGCGLLPDQWPAPFNDRCGYAGGLSPANLENQLYWLIPRRAYWIDVESGVRTDDRLDLIKVESFLKIAESFTHGPADADDR